MHRVAAAVRQVEVAELRIDLAEVRHRRDESRLQRLDRQDVLDSDAHRVASVPLRVGDHDSVCIAPEDCAQRVDLGDALPPRAGVYVSWDTKTVSGAMSCRRAARFGLPHDVSMTPAMCFTSSRLPWKALLAVTVPSTSQIGCTPRSRAASADSTTIPAAPIPMINPCRRLSKGSAASSTASSVAAAPEARKPEPTHRQVVGGDVVAGDDDDAAAAPGPDPVLGQGHGLGRAGACGVDLRVGPASADDLGELGVAHRQGPERNRRSKV